MANRKPLNRSERVGLNQTLIETVTRLAKAEIFSPYSVPAGSKRRPKYAEKVMASHLRTLCAHDKWGSWEKVFNALEELITSGEAHNSQLTELRIFCDRLKEMSAFEAREQAREQENPQVEGCTFCQAVTLGWIENKFVRAVLNKDHCRSCGEDPIQVWLTQLAILKMEEPVAAKKK